MSRNRNNGKFRNRSGEILFIEARNVGQLITVLTPGHYVGLPDEADDFDFIVPTLLRWVTLERHRRHSHAGAWEREKNTLTVI